MRAPSWRWAGQRPAAVAPTVQVEHDRVGVEAVGGDPFGRPAAASSVTSTRTPSGGGAPSAIPSRADRRSATVPVVIPDSARKALIISTPAWLTAGLLPRG